MDAHPGAPLLSVCGLSKSYAAPVLLDVDIELHPGEIHALVGANGAGKSTLARIICGLTDADAGSMALNGRPYAPRSKGDAEAAGVQMVMQELNLVETLSVAENLFFNRLPRRFGFVDRPALDRAASAALADVGLGEMDPATPVSRLGVGRQQLIEIAAALARPCRLLILDEPTAALTDPEIAVLFEHMRRLKKEGVGIVYVSHRMDEIRRITDRVTILRDGRVVDTQPTLDLSVDDVVQRMVGGARVEAFDPGEREIGPVALRVEGLCRGDGVRGVSFEVHSGEILGLAGLVGAGRTETLRTVFGADQPESGKVFRGESSDHLRIDGPRDAVRAGIGMIPEDRKQHGLLLPQSVRVNGTLAHLSVATRPKGWIRRMRETRVAKRLVDELNIQTSSVEQPVVELSGGNQQKVVMARWLLRACDVLLFDEPTRGIDVAAKQVVYRLISALAAQGKAVVVVSSELRELMALCDRIAVLSASRLTATFARDEWTEERIMAAAIGGHVHRAGSANAADDVDPGGTRRDD